MVSRKTTTEITTGMQPPDPILKTMPTINAHTPSRSSTLSTASFGSSSSLIAPSSPDSEPCYEAIAQTVKIPHTTSPQTIRSFKHSHGSRGVLAVDGKTDIGVFSSRGSEDHLKQFRPRKSLSNIIRPIARNSGTINIFWKGGFIG